MWRKIFSRRRDSRTSIAHARTLVIQAIRNLDEAGAPADIAAYLDLAVHRMSELDGR